MNKQEARLQEIEEKMEMVTQYFLKTGAPTRQIANYFTENFFPISNKTVSVYIHKYLKLHPGYKEEIETKIANNTEQDFSTEQIKQQVLIEVGLVLKGYKIEEIAQILDKSSSSVQRDLTARLKRLSEEDSSYKEFYDEVQKKLRTNQNSTIEENRKKWN